jgi:hypothetical protein
MLNRSRGQDARAPGGVVSIECAGKMDTALGGRAFAGDHAVAHDGERVRRGFAAGWFGDADDFSGLGRRGRHSYTSQFLVLVQHFHAGVNEWLTIRNSDREFFTWLPIGRIYSRFGSGTAAGRGVMRTIKGNIGAIRVFTALVVFRRSGADQKNLLGVPCLGE